MNAGAKRSGATCHIAMPQCCFLAKGAKRPSHTTNKIKFDRIPFDPCKSKGSTSVLSTRKIGPIYSHPFQPVALEIQGSLGESSENFITRLCKILCRSNDDQRAGSFLKQRISMVLQIGKAACVLGTVSDRDAVEETYYMQPNFFTLIS